MCAVRPRQYARAAEGRRKPGVGSNRGVGGNCHSPPPPETSGFALLDLTGATGQPDLPCCRLGTAESGWVVRKNRHLNYLVESVNVNAGGCPETEVPSSRGEKPGQRRSRPSSRRPGKPATGRRAAGDCQPLVGISRRPQMVGATHAKPNEGRKPAVMPAVREVIPGEPDAVKAAGPVRRGAWRNLHIVGGLL